MKTTFAISVYAHFVCKQLFGQEGHLACKNLSPTFPKCLLGNLQGTRHNLEATGNLWIEECRR